MDSQSVKEFYNGFSSSRMLSYRLHGNPRLDMAAERVLRYVREDSNVLDVGCGIGIVTERVADRAKHGQVLGVDISRQNIWYASRTAQHANLQFLEADVVADFDLITAKLKGKVNVVMMIDVIEHIPAEARPTLLKRLRALSEADATLVLAYPSPQYQEFLRAHEPQELQIIDNTIHLSDLVSEAGAAGYHLKHFSLETIWKRNQYVHCVFETDPAIRPAAAPTKRKLPLISGLANAVHTGLVVPYRRWKYVSRVFREQTR